MGRARSVRAEGFRCRLRPLQRKRPNGSANRELGILGAFSIGIGGIVGGGIFATLGLAGSEARGATHLSFLIGGIVALLTAYSYVHLSLAYPGPGGTVTYINRAFGGGVFAGGLNTLLVASYVVILALYASAFAAYGGSLLSPPPGASGRQALAIGVILLLALVNLAGGGLVERSEGVFNAGKLLILLTFIAAGLASPALTLARLSPADWVSPSKIVASGMLVFLSYEGFELIANASDRVKNPETTLPWAYYGSIGSAIVLYVLIVVVALGHLSFESLARAQDNSLSAAAQTFLGRFGFGLMAVGALLATASAINADFFGASKLPAILAKDGEMPRRYGREVWGRYPLGLLVIATLSGLIARFLDLHAISAAASAGFLMVFSMVNFGNARLAASTGSRAWISLLGAVACLGALATMLAPLVRSPEHQHAAWFILGLAVLPFVYEVGYRRISAWSRARQTT
jgi:amino acid transporter